MNEYLIPGLEPEEALDVLDDGGAELLGGGGGLDLVDHGERGGLEAPPRVRGDGRGVRVRRHGLGHGRALTDVHHGHCRRNMVGSLPRGMPKVVDYRQTDAQALKQDGDARQTRGFIQVRPPRRRNTYVLRLICIDVYQ